MRRMLGPVLAVALFGCPTEVNVNPDAPVAPTVTITSPSPGHVTSDAVAVDFVGSIADSNGLDTVQNAVWKSDRDGELGSGVPDASGVVRLSVSLSAGEHTVTLTAVDADGLEGSAAVGVNSQLDVQAPSVVIAAPLDNGHYVADGPIALYASVSDGQQSPDSLAAVWFFEPANGGARTVITSGAPSSSGVSEGSWDALTPGAWLVYLEVTDQDNNVGQDHVAVILEDPDQADQDNDGYPGATDCDDLDDQINPGENEACNGIDDNCSGVIDDKDRDNDGHVDIGCTLYAGPLPLDDCLDSNAAVYPGALEQADGVDNNCDGLIDEGTSLHDDDGDCYCESMVLCNDSGNPACVVLGLADCDDTDPLMSPADGDLDGASSCAGDCDDGNNGLNLNDFDGDGYSTCDGDCDDFNPVMIPLTCP